MAIYAVVSLNDYWPSSRDPHCWCTYMAGPFLSWRRQCLLFFLTPSGDAHPTTSLNNVFYLPIAHSNGCRHSTVLSTSLVCRRHAIKSFSGTSVISLRIPTLVVGRAPPWRLYFYTSAERFLVKAVLYLFVYFWYKLPLGRASLKRYEVIMALEPICRRFLSSLIFTHRRGSVCKDYTCPCRIPNFLPGSAWRTVGVRAFKFDDPETVLAQDVSDFVGRTPLTHAFP